MAMEPTPPNRALYTSTSAFHQAEAVYFRNLSEFRSQQARERNADRDRQQDEKRAEALYNAQMSAAQAAMSPRVIYQPYEDQTKIREAQAEIAIIEKITDEEIAACNAEVEQQLAELAKWEKTRMKELDELERRLKAYETELESRNYMMESRILRLEETLWEHGIQEEPLRTVYTKKNKIVIEHPKPTPMPSFVLYTRKK